MNKTTLTKNELKILVTQALYEILSDPDFGLELTEEAKKRLRIAKKSPAKKGMTLSDIKKKYY